MKHIQRVILFFILVIVGLSFNHQRMSSFPINIHAWAEADHYAVVLNFIENDLRFWEVETFVLNPQFPAELNETTENGALAMDFPLFHYGVAMVMTIIGNQASIVFRVLVFLFSCLSLVFFFNAVYLISKSYLKSLLCVLFVITSPVFIYYQNGMLISIPSLSISLIAFYYLIAYVKTRQFYCLVLCGILMTLASLMRMTYVMLMFSFLISISFFIFKNKAFRFKKEYLVFFISLLAIALYRYSHWLIAKEYGSIFLNHLLPAKGLSEFFEYFSDAWNRWKYDYFSATHYTFFLVSLVAAFFFRRKISQELKLVSSIVCLSIVASILFLIAMIRQFPQHDYYFLDTFFLPLVLLVVVGVSLLPNTREVWWKYIFLLVFFIQPAIHANDKQQERSRSVDASLPIQTVIELEDVSRLLDCMSISKEKRVLVMGAHGANLPLILCQRKGYSTIFNQEQDLRRSIDWNYDYLILPQGLFLDHIYREFPDIINRFERIGGNLKVGIFRKKLMPQQALYRFLGLDETSSHLFNRRVDFEGDEDTLFLKDVLKTNQVSYSGEYSYQLLKNKEFGLNFHIKGVDLVQDNLSLLLNFKVAPIINSGVKFVVLIKDESNDEILFSQSKDLKPFDNENNDWEDRNLLYSFPKSKCSSCRIEFFIWNPYQAQVNLDDLNIRVLRSQACN
ncbi:MAG: glycosyltransferase family 39 protein [Flavobacteriales bacterium]|nr:glycosyltransferase family 39 protein [Flavobacteriales bacterium]